MSLPMGRAPVTVIIPCYRCTSTLERAVASVAAQSEIPAELILVDDFSGDGTRTLMQKVISDYASGWIRTVLLDQNMGAASARNAGWSEATQSYIAFLDSDDAWHPEKIAIQLQYMQTHPNVALCGHAHKIMSDDVLPNWKLQYLGVEQIAERIGKWDLLLSNRFITPSAMIRRDIPQRFLELQRYMEDHMLWLNIVCAGLQVEKIKLPLAAIYKGAYGHAGLSAQLLKMELGDLGNYRRLLSKKYVTRLQFLVLILLSVAKFIRRLVIYNLFISRGGWT
jgi:Glycosyl transferase family 2